MKKRKVKGIGGKPLSYGIILLSIALIFLSTFLLLESRKLSSNLNGTATDNEDIALLDYEFKTYINEEFGYSISYPSLLQPRSIESENYLSLIIFFVPEGVSGDGFAISVRQNSLEEEKNEIIDEIESEAEIAKIEETSIENDKYQGIMLVFEPKDTTNFEKRSVAIFNNGRFSYTLSATPTFIEEVISEFNILD